MMFPVVRGLGIVSLIVVAAMVVIISPGPTQGAVDEDELAGFPERPSVFRNPDELKEYLRALNEYFAIAGRPR